MDPEAARVTAPEARELPPTLVEGLLRLCEGDFAFRMPRSRTRDTTDTAAFFVNTIAEELERILRESQQQEARLAQFVDRMSNALIAVAAGDFGAEVERDFAGDPPDVLAFLLNNTIAELGMFVAAAQHKAEEDRHRLEALVQERTRELDRLATTDLLTETFNRRRIAELGEQEVGRAARYGTSLCVVMLDLDHFKAINDTYGHAVGDLALRCAADAIRSRVRAHDHIGRYGGEEFVVIAPNTSLDGAAHLAEAVRHAIDTASCESGGRRVALSTSVGVAEWTAGETLDAVLTRADRALYSAKAAGRNRVMLAAPPPA